MKSYKFSASRRAHQFTSLNPQSINIALAFRFHAILWRGAPLRDKPQCISRCARAEKPGFKRLTSDKQCAASGRGNFASRTVLGSIVSPGIAARDTPTCRARGSSALAPTGSALRNGRLSRADKGAGGDGSVDRCRAHEGTVSSNRARCPAGPLGPS